MQEPCVCKTYDIGEKVKLSPDLLFKVKSTDEKVKYEWRIDDERIKEDDHRYKISDAGVLSIQEFEKMFEGQYVCTFSTASRPMMSVSTQVRLNLTGKEINRLLLLLLLSTLIKNIIMYRSSRKI
jgi:hypothetical protein